MGIFRNLLNVLKLSKLASMPDWQRAYLASRAFAADGDWERAAMWGRIAAQENPASAEVWNDLGFALNGLGQAKWNTAPPETLMPQASLPEQPLVELGDAAIRRALARAKLLGRGKKQPTPSPVRSPSILASPRRSTITESRC